MKKVGRLGYEKSKIMLRCARNDQGQREESGQISLVVRKKSEIESQISDAHTRASALQGSVSTYCYDKFKKHT